MYQCVHSVWLVLPGDVNKQTRTVALPDSEFSLKTAWAVGSKGTELVVGKGGTAESCKIF